ncbi:MAG: zinc-ribbon domain-containing protein [Butyricicoccaceae bacterium]
MDILDLINEFDPAMLGQSPIVGTIFAAFHSMLIVLTVLGFLNCFFGYRIFRIFAALSGLGIGAGIGAMLVAMEPDNTGMMLMGIVSAIVLAAATFFAFRVAAFLMGAFFGLAVGMILVGWQSLSMDWEGLSERMLAQFGAELLVPALVLGLLSVLFYRTMIILLTGLGGVLGVYGVCELLQLDFGPMVWAFGLACSIIGIGVQFQFNPRGTLPGPGKWKQSSLPAKDAVSAPVAPAKPVKAAQVSAESDATVRIRPKAPAAEADMDQTARITPDQMRARMKQAKTTVPEPPAAAPAGEHSAADDLMEQIQASVGETVREIQAEAQEEVLFGDIEQAIHARIEAEQTQTEYRYCIHCGTKNDVISKFCTHCGKELV